MATQDQTSGPPAPDGFEPPRDPAFLPSASDISCEQARRQIERFIEDHDLKETERVLLSAHVKACAKCHAILEQTQRIEARLKETFSSLETQPSFQKRLSEALARTEMLPAPAAPATPRSEPIQTRPATSAVGSISQTIRQPGTQTRNSEPELIEAKVTGPLSEISDAPTRRVETGGHIAQSNWGRRLWNARMGIAAAVLIAVGLSMAYFRGRDNGVDDSPPTLMAVGAGGTVSKDNGSTQALTVGHVLLPNHAVTAGSTPLPLTLTSGNESIGRVVLAPGSSLRAQNRHTYTVMSGSAYFQVFKSRPQASPGEYFDVNAGGLGTVRVTGTAFVVDMAAAEGALVVVEEGKIEVLQTGRSTAVSAGQELAFGAGKRPRESNVASRLAWLNPPAVASANVPPVSPGKPVGPPKPAAPMAAAPQGDGIKAAQFDWDTPVGPLALYGKTLADGVELVAEKLEQPAALTELVEHARKFGTPSTLSFSISSKMPVRSILAWMARDLGLRFEIGPAGEGSFRTAGAEQPVGPAVEGSLPPEIAKALQADVPGDGLVGADTLPVFLRQVGAACGVPMLCSRDLWERFEYVLNAPGPAPRPAEAILRDLMRRAGANAAWYDGVLYIAPASQIEALTTIERMSPQVQHLVGQPLQPNCARDLKTILERCAYPPPQLSGGPLTDGMLAEKPAFTEVRLEPGNALGPVFTYRTGLAGKMLMEETLKSLSGASPQVAGAAGVLSQHGAPGVIADVDVLIAQAREFMMIESRAKLPPFARSAFVNKSLMLGEAIEWAAWLTGHGLRQENNTLLIDEYDACYGPKQLQVLSLKSLCERHREISAGLPGRLALLLPALYPTFFSDVRGIYCLQNAVVFHGDRRQLRVGQRLLSDLEVALDAPSFKPTQLQSWRPSWRIEMEAKLSEPFASSGADKLTGSFAWLLRQSVLSSQIHCTVLVDPGFMKDHWSDEVKDLPVSNLTVAQVIERLAARVGLKMAIEGDVVWLKP